MSNLFLHIKLKRDLTSHQTLLEHGLKKEISDLLESEMDLEKDSTRLKILRKFLGLNNKLQLKKKSFVMLEFLQIIKKKICIDKLNYYNGLIPQQKSYRISVLDLILKEKGFQPFWTKLTQEISQKLWLPTKTDCVDSDLNLSNGFLKNPKQNSWFLIQLQIKKDHKILLDKMNLQKIFLQSQLSLSQETMVTDLLDTENNEKKNLKNKKKKINNKSRKNRSVRKNKSKKDKSDELSAIKLQVYPDPEQKIILDKWFGASRFVYNKCLGYINKECSLKQPDFKLSSILNKKHLRSKFINNPNYKIDNNWMLEIPYDIRDESMRDLLKNYNSNFAKKTKFQLNYKRLKEGKCNSINILSKHWNHKDGMYSKVFTSNLKCERKLPANMDYTSRIIKDELGKFYICIPSLRKKETIEITTVLSYDNQVDRSVSIDPGVITPLTCYDPTGKIIKIGTGCLTRLFRLFHHKNKLQGLMAKTTKHSIRYKYKKAILRLSQKIKNLVTDSHRQISLWLCQNYNIILIPKMNFHNFKKMTKRTKTKMALWNHCSFVDKLIDKSKEFKNCSVRVVQEDYTSKTCGNCGFIKEDLGRARTFNCNKCLVSMDRDTCGSRNILLKYVTEHQSFQISENL